MKNFISHSEIETKRFGQKIGSELKNGDCVALYGELGAGKTVLIKGIVQGMGCDELVKSPSFITVNEYRYKVPIFHIDLYRIKNETPNLDLTEYFYGKGICLIEWAERAKDILPDKRIEVFIKVIDETTRKIILNAKC